MICKNCGAELPDGTKINVIMKGKLECSGKAAKDVRIRFIYDRSSGTAFVKE